MDHVTTPKMLPWLARKAGIPLHRAEVLWQAAQSHAALYAGKKDASAYWQAVVDRLLELMAAESEREDEASFGWRRWARLNNRFWQAQLAALDVLTLNSMRGWQQWRPLRFG